MLLLILSLLYYGFRDKMLKRRPSKRFVLLESGETETTTTTTITTSLLSSPILSSTVATTTTNPTTTANNSENVHNNNNNNCHNKNNKNNNNVININDNDLSDHYDNASQSGRDLHRRNSEPANPRFSIGGKIKMPPLARILFNGSEEGDSNSEDRRKAQQIANQLVPNTVIK